MGHVDYVSVYIVFMIMPSQARSVVGRLFAYSTVDLW